METFDVATLIALHRDAVALAARAKAEMDSAKSVSTPKFREALRLWDTSTQNAIRLARNLRLAGAEPQSLEDELAALTGA